MDLTVVIRCGNDERVFNCIKSIDTPVEIIVSTSANAVFEEKLRTNGIKYVLSPRNNLSQTSNIGFVNAKYDKVFITDSDTLFEPNCLAKIEKALENFLVARAKIRFLEDSNLKYSKKVGEARDFVNSLPLVYTPGVGVRKEIVKQIGGFLFDDPVPYAVDANLDFRIKYAKIPVAFLEDAYIQHVPENRTHDLKAAYRIGKGTAISTYLLRKRGYKMHWNALKGVKARHYKAEIKSKGWGVFLYQLKWDFMYYRGHLRQKWFGNRKLNPGSEGQKKSEGNKNSEERR